MVIIKFFIEGRCCSLADFSGICIQPTWLYRENYNETVDSISSRDRKFGVMVMESTDVRRIHSKEKILFCKEWCVYCSYTHRLSKRKRNWHFVCVPLWLCFVKLRTNILGQATCNLLFAALVCFHNETRTGLRTSCFLQSRCVIPILNNNCYEFTIRRHWIAERSYSQWSIRSNPSMSKMYTFKDTKI